MIHRQQQGDHRVRLLPRQVNLVGHVCHEFCFRHVLRSFAGCPVGVDDLADTHTYEQAQASFPSPSDSAHTPKNAKSAC